MKYLCRGGTKKQSASKPALMIHQRLGRSIEVRNGDMTGKIIDNTPKSGTLKSSLRSLRNEKFNSPEKKAHLKKSSEYFIEKDNVKQTSRAKTRNSDHWIDYTFKLKSELPSSKVTERDLQAFISLNHNDKTKNTLRWDTYSQTKRAELKGMSDLKNRIDRDALRRFSLGKASSDSRKQQQLEKQVNMEASGSSRIKSILNQINTTSSLKKKRNMAERHKSDVNLIFRKMEDCQESDYEPKSEKDDSLIRNVNLRNALLLRDKSKSQSFGGMLKETDSYKLQSFLYPAKPEAHNSQKDNCAILLGMNSILKGWKDCFPEMFSCLSESLSDRKTAKERLDRVQTSFSQAFKVKKNLATDLIGNSADSEKRLTILLSENIFLMERIQEMIETNLSSMSKNLKEDKLIMDIFGHPRENS